MSAIDKIRLETSSALDFAMSNKIGFSVETCKDYNIVNTMKALKQYASSGQLRHIPADVPGSELTNAVYHVLGTPKTEAVLAAEKAGTPVYDVIATYTRVFEQSDEERPGRAQPTFAGLGGTTESILDS